MWGTYGSQMRSFSRHISIQIRLSFILAGEQMNVWRLSTVSVVLDRGDEQSRADIISIRPLWNMSVQVFRLWIALSAISVYVFAERLFIQYSYLWFNLNLSNKSWHEPQLTQPRTFFVAFVRIPTVYFFFPPICRSSFYSVRSIYSPFVSVVCAGAFAVAVHIATPEPVRCAFAPSRPSLVGLVRSIRVLGPEVSK